MFDSFREAIASEGMISKEHSIVLARVKPGSNIESLKSEIKQKVNPQKWICVGIERDQIIVDSIDDVIILIMTNFYPEQFQSSFNTLR